MPWKTPDGVVKHCTFSCSFSFAHSRFDMWDDEEGTHASRMALDTWGGAGRGGYEQKITQIPVDAIS